MGLLLRPHYLETMEINGNTTVSSQSVDLGVTEQYSFVSLTKNTIRLVHDIKSCTSNSPDPFSFTRFT